MRVLSLLMKVVEAIPQGEFKRVEVSVPRETYATLCRDLAEHSPLFSEATYYNDPFSVTPIEIGTRRGTVAFVPEKVP